MQKARNLSNFVKGAERIYISEMKLFYLVQFVQITDLKFHANSSLIVESHAKLFLRDFINMQGLLALHPNLPVLCLEINVKIKRK